MSVQGRAAAAVAAPACSAWWPTSCPAQHAADRTLPGGLLSCRMVMGGMRHKRVVDYLSDGKDLPSNAAADAIFGKSTSTAVSACPSALRCACQHTPRTAGQLDIS